MFDKLKLLELKHEELGRQLADPSITPSVYTEHAKAYAELEEVVSKYKEYKKLLLDESDTREMLKGAEQDMKDLAQEELTSLRGRKEELESALQKLLLSEDPNDKKNVILEVRAGTGGDEAAIFAGELFRMYNRYADDRKWTVQIMDTSEAAQGGYKEVVAVIEGKGAFSRLKYESGTHRVQRVPTTESSGRIHTSAVTVAVLPEAEEVDIQIAEKDLRIDTYCSSGPGGQSVNTTYSAVRITHIPSGCVVTCQDEKSQHKNKAKAMRVLRSRIHEIMQEEADAERAAARKGMVGSGDRAEKIRTYNFPQGRVTDHRIKMTVHQIQAFLDGDIDAMVDSLTTHYEAERLNDEIKV
jgi:peptide chain release factor 1